MTKTEAQPLEDMSAEDLRIALSALGLAIEGKFASALHALGTSRDAARAEAAERARQLQLIALAVPLLPVARTVWRGGNPAQALVLAAERVQRLAAETAADATEAA